MIGSFTLWLMAGCVSKGKYDAALDDVARAREVLAASRTASEQALTDKQAEIAELKQAIANLEARRSRTAADLELSRGERQECSQELDEATVLNQQMRAELEKLGTDVDQLLSDKGALASSLDQARARLEELRRSQAAAEKRAQLFRDIALRLKRMVDAGDLQIVLRSGRMVLSLPNDVLFDSGKAEIKPQGREALEQVAGVLATIEDRRFQVAGHTDNEPIRRSGFESNWDLSAARALNVVEFLIQSGMSPETLSAAGYGEFDPVAPNDSPEDKAKNRRIEITLQPNIDELVPVPKAQ